jgi:DNA-binding response OmpR family regulator
MASTILLADNDKMLLQALKSELEKSGFAIASAEDGKKAVQILAGGVPDLVLSEVALPGVDGYALLKELRQSREGKLTPFLFLTSRCTREDVLKGIRQGADLYLTKPITSGELLGYVRSRLERFSEIKGAVA